MIFYVKGMPNNLIVVGEKGYIEVNAPFYAPTKLLVKKNGEEPVSNIQFIFFFPKKNRLPFIYIYKNKNITYFSLSQNNRAQCSPS